MKLDLEELKVKEAKALATNGTVHEGPEWAEFTHALGLAFPAIVAKLEAAQRLRDALDGQADGIADAIDAFDAVVTK